MKKTFQAKLERLSAIVKKRNALVLFVVEIRTKNGLPTTGSGSIFTRRSVKTEFSSWKQRLVGCRAVVACRTRRFTVDTEYTVGGNSTAGPLSRLPSDFDFSELRLLPQHLKGLQLVSSTLAIFSPTHPLPLNSID